MKRLLNSKFSRNFSILTGANLAIQVLSILSSIRLARELQPEGYGLFNLVNVQASIFSIIAAYGLRIVVIRHIARSREDARKLFTISSRIRLATTFIAVVSAIGYNLLLSSDQSLAGSALFVLAILIVFQTFWDTIESISFGFEKMEATGIINLLFTVIWVCQVYIIPSANFSVTVLLMVFAFNQIAKSVAYYLWLHKSILNKQPKTAHISIDAYKDIIRQSNYYFVLAVFTAVQNQIPILFLQFNSTVDQIGQFNLGYRILSPLQMILNMLLTAIFPMFSRLAVENIELFGKRIKTLLNIIVLVGIWGGICFALFSDDVVHLLYGDKYLTSAKVILVQCWYTILYAIFCLNGTVLSSFDKQKLLAIFSVVSGLIALPIFYFGSQYGAIGLAWSFVIAAFVNMTYLWFYFMKLLKNKIPYTYSILVFGSIGVLSWATSAYPINWSFTVRVGAAIILSIWVFGYLYKVEYKKIQMK